MSERLISVGLDVGTTSTQMIFSELLVENRASSFAVPEMEIAQRRILYKSPVHFTPLLDESRVDAGKLREIVDREYENAGFSRGDVDTGAIIITGETSRKENARSVLQELSGYAGEFVVATAGPDLESILAAKGAGAAVYSENTGKTVLHMDIGGGTSNLALIRDGKIVATGCLNVGGRLLKFDGNGKVTYVSPVLAGITDLKVGDIATPAQVEGIAKTLVQALEMAAGLRQPEPLLAKLTTEGTTMEPPEEETVISFSGGVADCIQQDIPWLEFGDMGPILGRSIRESRLCGGEYTLGSETIRATVIGAGCHSAQLSGSTVFYRNLTFPLKNLPVIALSREQQGLPADRFADLLRREQEKQEGASVVALPGIFAPGYWDVVKLAEAIREAIPEGPVLICLEQDMAKALGQALAVRLPEDRPILCIDRVKLTGESYLDVGTPVGPALPVVVKTLVLSQ